MTPRRQPERALQAQIVQLLRSVGCQVYVLGTTRRRGDYHGTMQTPGLPDLIAFLPRALGVLCVEVKAPRGRLRREQAQFRDSALACTEAGRGVYYATGDLDAVIATLIGVRLLTAEQVPHYRTVAPEGGIC